MEGQRSTLATSARKKPWAVKFRASVGFCTAVVFLSLFCDLLVYSVIIPIIPFRLQQLGNDPAISSSLTGWLLALYSLGLVSATPLLVFLVERYLSRRTLMLTSVLLLIGCQVLLMEVTTFWLMCLARLLEGVSCATVWVVAFSLLCDTVPEEQLGRQLGIVMTGLTLGVLLGPPISGVLNDTKLGYRAPFIFSIAVSILDFFGCLFVLEKHEATPWLVGTHPSSPETPQTRQEPGERLPIIAMGRPKSQMSFLRVIVTLSRSKRAFTAFFELYGFGSLQVGIVFVSTAIPSLFSTPLAGWISDKAGVEWVTVSCMLLSAPCWIVMAIRGPLALLITSLAFARFLLSAVVTPLTADLAAAARELDGIGYAHVFGVFNFAYSCSSAIGSLIGGQIYSRANNGWTILMGFSAGMGILAAVAAAFGAGDRPLVTRLTRLRRQSAAPVGDDATQRQQQ